MQHYEFAKIAYDAYCLKAGGVSLVSGEKLPEFYGLRNEIQDAWHAASEAVIRAVGVHLVGENS